MIKEAMKYFLSVAQPITVQVDGQTYSRENLIRVVHDPIARCLELTTLSSLVDYIKGSGDVDGQKWIIHVESPTKVNLLSELDFERRRENLIAVTADIPAFEFGRYITNENFLIGIQSKFLPNADRELIMRFAGTVETGTVATYGDDGVTQKATVKKGISSKTEAIVPNPVTLKPFRTFNEVDQPESQFVFRMKENERYGVECALIEADGGAWKNRAVKNIKEYLEKNLEGVSNIMIIS